MTIECPECQHENQDDSTFCAKCGTKIDADIEPTKTIETPTEELRRGSVFAGRYEIIEELGKGGMGKVYRVEDTKVNEEIALKLIKPEIAADKKTIERFRNELTTSRKITHKNVCRMYDLGEEKGSHFITMEYISGQDLKGLMRQTGQLTVGKAISIAKQLCEGLSEAHSLGVVHRDLKPSNIMIDDNGNAKIMDFGIARMIREKGITGSGVMIGTPEYMSPEQAEAKEIDPLSDVYSLGVILYEMVTGRVPFEGSTALSIAMKHKSEIPKNPKDYNAQIPDDLSHLILRCLEKDKDKRYKSAAEVRDELEKEEKSIPTADREIPKRKTITSKEITVTLGIKKILIPAVILVSLVATALVIWLLLPNNKSVITPTIENSLAVISFENQTGEKSLDHLQKVIPNLLITNLENTEYFYVVTWERMHDLLKQIGKGNAEVIDKELGFELCRKEGVESIILGSYAKAGNMFATDVKVMDVRTKKLLCSTSAKGEGADSILKTQIDDISRDIALGMGMANQKIESEKTELIDVTTSSMEAYNYFLMGKEAQRKKFITEARQLYEKALEIDPTFASASLYLSQTRYSLGDTEGRIEAIENAKAFSEKVTEREKLYIEAAYAREIEGNREKRFQILKQLAEKYPKEKNVHRALANYYQSKRMTNEALEEFNKALVLDPNYDDALNDLAFLYADMGDFNHSLEYLNKYASLFPGDATPLASIAEVYFKMSRPDETISNLKEALKISPNYYRLYWTISYIYAFKEDYTEALKWIDQYIATVPYDVSKIMGIGTKGLYLYWLGQIKDAFYELNTGLELAIEKQNPYGKGFIDTMMAWIYYEIGEYKTGQQHYAQQLDFVHNHDPVYTPYYTADSNLYFGLIDLKLGKFDSARSRLTIMNSVLDQIEPVLINLKKFHNELFRAELLLAEGKAEEVIRMNLKGIWVKTPPIRQDWRTIVYNIPFCKNVLARAYQKTEEIEEAIAEYERLMNISANGENRLLIYPKYHYWLARLYEKKGNALKAIEHYEKFLSLWKDADPGIPEIVDTRERLAGLRE